MSFAEVVFNLPVDHPFTYKIPQELHYISPGWRVLAPFGRRTMTGVVVSLIEQTYFKKLKNLIDTPDDQPMISEKMLELTRWMSEYYVCSWGQALQLALPKGSERRVEERVHLADLDREDTLGRKENELLQLIGSDPGKAKHFYRKKFGESSFYSSLRRLTNKGLIKIELADRKGRTQALVRQFVTVPENYQEVKHNFPDFLRYIEKKPDVDLFMQAQAGKKLLRTEFIKQTGMAVGTLKKMEKLGICGIEQLPLERRPTFQYQEPTKNIKLSASQKGVIDQVARSARAGQFTSFLLHGVTGSGKTQVYIEVSKMILKQGQNVIILIPEIALTPQMVTRFQAVFGDDAAVFHSRMSRGERHDAWMRCVRGDVRIVIGPRSALFVPMADIGLIVVDEEHESSYKQTEGQPRYHARDVALYWGRMNQAQILLGSATPSLESYHNARKGKHVLLEIPERILNIALPRVEIVDARSLRGSNVSTIFSKVLLTRIEERINRNEQVIILQNRRGHTSYVQCVRCGYISVCPHCELSLTYHSFDHKLRCHFCGYEEVPADFCPSCAGEQIQYSGAGTQKIEKELQRLLPGVRILRMDLDTTRGKNMHDRLLQAFSKREADILLGTQMVAKGLDFPAVTLVGVVSADIGLSVPDFRAAERVFQLMMQVSGRSGRSGVRGEVIIQAMNTTHYAIQLACSHDFNMFFNQEIVHRRSNAYPPFTRLIKILVVTGSLHEAISLSRVLSSQIRKQLPAGAVQVGPAPDLYPRLHDQYRWQINIKLPADNAGMGRIVKKQIRDIVDPYFTKPKQDIQVHIDVDPFSI